jgi:hypothetical protein
MRSFLKYVLHPQNMKISENIAYFLAICAASEYGCDYLSDRLIKKYKEIGGDI